jgi:hypothetical protein
MVVGIHVTHLVLHELDGLLIAQYFIGLAALDVTQQLTFLYAVVVEDVLQDVDFSFLVDAAILLVENE